MNGVGYLFDLVALLLGGEAWPSSTDPEWQTIVGFAQRYMARLKQRKGIEQAKRQAELR